MRYRSINPYVANSLGGWSVPHRLPVQSGPSFAANAGTSSFGMSGVNAHAIILPPADEQPAGRGGLALASWSRSLRCFIEVLVPLHPLLGSASKARQQLQFKLALSKAPLAFLWDHRVQSAAIMPGAAYFEMAAAAGRTLLRLAEPCVALTGAAIAAPLRLPAPAEAQVVTVAADVRLVAGEVSIRSAAAGDSKGAETLHLRGSLTAARAVVASVECLPADGASGRCISADAARAACLEPLDTAAVYEGLRLAGLQYGPAFRRLRGIAQGPSAAAARLDGRVANGSHDASVSGFLMHPTLLDSCLQLGALVPEEAAPGGSPSTDGGGAFVPAGLAVYLIQQPLQEGSCPVTVVRRSPQAARRAAGATYRDHVLVSETGAVLSVLDGLEAKQLQGSGGARAGTAAAKQLPQAELLYEVSWQAAVQAATAQSVLDGAAGMTTLGLRDGGSDPVRGASSSLAVLQAALEQQSAALQLSTVSSVVAGASSASAMNVGGNALWGMLRAFAQEAPAVSHGGSRWDPQATVARGRGVDSSLVLAASASAKVADGYGSQLLAGTALHAVLLPSGSVQPALAPYHLMPRPRGAFR
jgi:acyl transferase domain-containing protein